MRLILIVTLAALYSFARFDKAGMPPERPEFSIHDFLTVRQAAEILGVTAATLRNWDRAGKLKPVRHPVNGYRLYRRADLEALIRLFVPTAKEGR